MDATTINRHGSDAPRHASPVTRRRPTVRRGRHGAPPALRRALIPPCLVMLGFGLTNGLENVLTQPGDAPVRVTTARDSVEPSTTAGQRLMDKHDCWSGQTPAEHAGKVPGAAVVVPAGSDEPVHGSTWVEPAFEHVFEGRRPGLTVLGFCAS